MTRRPLNDNLSDFAFALLNTAGGMHSLPAIMGCYSVRSILFKTEVLFEDTHLGLGLLLQAVAKKLHHTVKAVTY
jgi:hypothetical protein